MKIKNHDLSREDCELCRSYEQEMKQKRFSARKAFR